MGRAGTMNYEEKLIRYIASKLIQRRYFMKKGGFPDEKTSAKLRHLKGVPRLVLNNTSKLKTRHIKFLFAKDENYYSKIDEKYFNLIEEDCVEEFLNEIDCVVVFDLCRMSFLENDELFNFAPNKIKKIFKLNQRNEEKNNFIQSNNICSPRRIILIMLRTFSGTL